MVQIAALYNPIAKPQQIGSLQHLAMLALFPLLEL